MKYLFPCILLFILSCSKEIEIQIPEQSPKLVVISNFYNASSILEKPFNVKVQQTIPIFDTTENLIVNDATVCIEHNDIIDTLHYVDSLGQAYYFKNFEYSPDVGTSHKLTVEKSGFPTVTAHSSLPKQVSIDSFSVIPMALINNLEEFDIWSEIELHFTDPKEQENYYEIAVSRRYLSYDNYFHNNYYEIYTNNALITSQSYYPSLIRFDLHKPKRLLFDDKTIDGDKNILKIYYSVPGFMGYGIAGNYGNHIGAHTITVQLRSVTKEYFKYKTSLIQQGYGIKEDFLYGMAEPLNVYSNIENGYGIFSGVNASVVLKDFDEIFVGEYTKKVH